MKAVIRNLTLTSSNAKKSFLTFIERGFTSLEIVDVGGTPKLQVDEKARSVEISWEVTRVTPEKVQESIETLVWQGKRLQVLSACPLEVRYGTSTMLRYKGLTLALNLWQRGRYVGPDDSEEDARRKPFCMIVNLKEDATKLPEIERALEVLGIGSNTSNKRHSKYLAVFRKDDIRGFVALDDGMRLFVVGAVEGGVFDKVGGKDVGLAVEQFTQAVEVSSVWRAANQTVSPPTMIAQAAGELPLPAADEHPQPEEKTIEGSEHIPQQDISLEAASIVAQSPKADKRGLEAPAPSTTIPAVYRTSKGVTRMDLTIPAAMDTLAELRSAALCAGS
ncbi:hypothetical protein HK104_000812 [Borealophlyctis nickersoniae]|nr:hypothetical protein HK104_000812 [Borealophlyctis nickersoniae]